MATFSRRHYIVIADAMNSAYRYFKDVQQPNESTRYAANGVEHTAVMLADRLEGDNPRFDREHFLAVVRGEREIESRVPRSRDAHRGCKYLGNNAWDCGHIDQSDGPCDCHACDPQHRS